MPKATGVASTVGVASATDCSTGAGALADTAAGSGELRCTSALLAAAPLDRVTGDAGGAAPIPRGARTPASGERGCGAESSPL